LKRLALAPRSKVSLQDKFLSPAEKPALPHFVNNAGSLEGATIGMSVAFDLPTTPRDTGNYTDRAGAEKLKARIEAYWRERGYEIQITLAPAAFTPALRASRFDIRSELLDGLPRACCLQGCAKAA
jgi:hypothetical protein